MNRFIWSQIVPERSVNADGVYVFDCGVNPLSGLLIGLRPLNDTASITSHKTCFEIAAKSLTLLRVIYKGTAIVAMSGSDIYAMNYLRCGMMPREGCVSTTDNFRRYVPVPVPLGRFFYDGRCCLPKCSRGDVQVELTLDIADTGYDNLNLTVDALELPGAEPSEYERRVTLSRTFSATGQNDVFLPVGNALRGIQLWGNTGFAAGSPAPTLGNVSLLVNSEQTLFHGVDFEATLALNSLIGRGLPGYSSHSHVSSASPTTQVFGEGSGWEKYSFLDFDPTRTDAFGLDLKGNASALLRVNVETADACRIVPVERVPV